MLYLHKVLLLFLSSPVNKFNVVLDGVEQLLCSTPEVLHFSRE